MRGGSRRFGRPTQSMYELGIAPVFWTEDEPDAPVADEPTTDEPAAIPSDVDELVEMMAWM